MHAVAVVHGVLISEVRRRSKEDTWEEGGIMMGGWQHLMLTCRIT